VTSTLSSTPGAQTSVPEAPTQVTTAPARLVSLDAARGLAIVVMLVTMNPGPQWQRPDQLRHPVWDGLTFVDLFFPLFLFAVGVSMTLSSRGLDTRHVLRRAVILFALGVALSLLRNHTLTYTGVLQHIAISYVVAFAVLRTPRRWHLPLTIGIVGAIWAGYVLWALGDDPWGRTGTLAHAVDGALIGRFSTEGLMQALISSVTVLAGAFAGRLIQAVPDRRRLFGILSGWAVGLSALGLLIATVVPLNKRLWSPSFLVLTIGTSLAILAAYMWLADIHRIRRPLAPLVHVGVNPITIYVLFMAVLALFRNYGGDLAPAFTPLGSPALGYVAYGVGWFALWWLLAFYMYRRRIFIKI
jgi:predicted acyltransferase